VGGQQCPGAHTTDDIEFWPVAALAPTVEETGTEGTVLATARDGE